MRLWNQIEYNIVYIDLQEEKKLTIEITYCTNILVF